MALIETSVGYGVGIPIGYVGARWIGSAAGAVFRPIAKTVIKGALAVGDMVGEAYGDEPKHRKRNGQRPVAIAVEAKAASTVKRGARSHRRPPSARRKASKPRKAAHR